jgi:hypothetical protein
VTWYTWLEQGRPIKVSGEALGRIARALQLNPTEGRYLFTLAGVAWASPATAPAPLSPMRDIQVVVDGLGGIPALVWDALGDIVAYNKAADALFDFRGHDSPFARNHAWRLFRDPERKALYANWEDVARRTVGYLRMRHSRYAGDERLERLLAELRLDEDFVRLWGRAMVLPEATVELVLRHPRLGSMHVRSVRLLLTDADDHAMVTLVPADARTKVAFRRLRPSHLR